MSDDTKKKATEKRCIKGLENDYERQKLTDEELRQTGIIQDGDEAGAFIPGTQLF
jgi:hypothetical protein